MGNGHLIFKLKRDWVGATVETPKPIRNGMGSMPAGTHCVVKENYKGLSLESDPCPHCGIQFYVTRVSEESVIVLSGGKTKEAQP